MVSLNTFFGYRKGQNCKINKVIVSLLPDLLENSYIKPYYICRLVLQVFPNSFCLFSPLHQDVLLQVLFIYFFSIIDHI